MYSQSYCFLDFSPKVLIAAGRVFREEFPLMRVQLISSVREAGPPRVSCHWAATLYYSHPVPTVSHDRSGFPPKPQNFGLSSWLSSTEFPTGSS